MMKRISFVQRIKLTNLFILLGFSLALAFFLSSKRVEDVPGIGPLISKAKRSLLTKENIAQVVSPHVHFFHFPNEVQIPQDVAQEAGLNRTDAIVQYAFDPSLQEQVQNLMKAYSPDYGAFVAIEPTTGRILSMVSYVHDLKKDEASQNLALRATFPSASVFKVVTAAAAIEQRKFDSDTVFAFQGSNHTLYKSNVLKMKYNRWTRNITLKEAFAKSVNTVFGRIGVYNVGATNLRQYADKFGFNRKIASDIEVDQGRAPIPTDDWGLAEAASGYTRENTMSPLQGALIAAAIANQGKIMEPYLVDSVFSKEGVPLYTVEPRLANQAIDPQTAAELKQLMRQTVKAGTSRNAFRSFVRDRNFFGVDVGGKTGSLTGLEPKGKYDWFVGYADNGTQKIAVAALSIHGQFWKVKSAYLARKAIEIFFKDKLAPAPRPKHVVESGMRPEPPAPPAKPNHVAQRD